MRFPFLKWQSIAFAGCYNESSIALPCCRLRQRIVPIAAHNSDAREHILWAIAGDKGDAILTIDTGKGDALPLDKVIGSALFF